MQKSLYFAPPAENEPVLSYKKGSPEREELVKVLEEARSNVIDVPMVINGKHVTTDKKIEIHPRMIISIY